MPETGGGGSEDYEISATMEEAVVKGVDTIFKEIGLEKLAATCMASAEKKFDGLKFLKLTSHNQEVSEKRRSKSLGNENEKGVNTRFDLNAEREGQEDCIGPNLLGPSNIFLSFDEACLRSKATKPKPKKV